MPPKAPIYTSLLGVVLDTRATTGRGRVMNSPLTSPDRLTLMGARIGPCSKTSGTPQTTGSLIRAHTGVAGAGVPPAPAPVI